MRDSPRAVVGRYGSVWFVLPFAASVALIVTAVLAFTGGGQKRERFYVIHGVRVSEEGALVLRSVERRRTSRSRRFAW
jgi:hypothetical protein